MSEQAQAVESAQETNIQAGLGDQSAQPEQGDTPRAEKFDYLFEDMVEPSEAELRGEVEEQSEEQSAGEETESPAPKDESAKEQQAEAQPEPEKQEAKEDEGKSEKPPEGFVPHQALREERLKRQEAQAQFYELQAQLEQVQRAMQQQQQPQGEEQAGDGFKEISDKEFKELRDSDPDEAMEYLYRLNAHREQKWQREQQAREQQQAMARERAIVDDARHRVFREIGDAETREKLSRFAIDEMGLSNESLRMMTDPSTLIYDEKAGKVMPIADAAVEVVHAIKAAASMKGSTDEAALRAKIEKELTEKITAQVTKELTGKLKTAGGSAHRSLSAVPSGSDDSFGGKMLSDSEVAKMSEKELRDYLGG